MGSFIYTLLSCCDPEVDYANVHNVGCSRYIWMGPANTDLIPG